ncbi:MAG: hypothetical protein KDK51_08090, partial [Deltaproteobacteria bacterium]|nr:hypothetical protein [Deltaproteobacteria bacterium]
MSGNHPIGYEKTDVNVKKTAIATLLPAVIIIACIVGLRQYMTLTQESMYYDQVLNVDDQMYKEMVQ